MHPARDTACRHYDALARWQDGVCGIMADAMAGFPAATITAVAPVYPSEDSVRVEVAVRNVFDGKTRRREFSIVSEPSDASSLGPVRDSILTGAESRRAYERNLEENMQDCTTWFYLNKQAAFAGRVALCEEAAESPLGPIKITISAGDLGRVVDWLLAGYQNYNIT